MSVNLLDLAKGAMNQQVMQQIGGIISEDEEKTSSAISVALPSLIGGLIGQAGSDRGLQQISQTLDEHDDGILDQLEDVLGANQQQFINTGSGLLGSILGDQRNGIINLLLNVTGLNKTKMGSLLGILAPVLMGVLGRQRKSLGLDLGGLAEMILGQKKHIASSLPPGFRDLEGIGSSSRPAGQPNTSGGSLIGKLFPLVALLVAGFLLLKILPEFSSKREVEPEIEAPLEETMDDLMPRTRIDDGPLQDAFEGRNGGIIIEDGPLSTAIESDEVEGDGVELDLNP